MKQIALMGLMAAVAASVGLLCGASDGGSQSEAKDAGLSTAARTDGGPVKQTPHGSRPATKVGGIEWVFSKPAKVFLAKTETTVAQYRACVDAGKCTKPGTNDDDKYCNWGYGDRDKHPINCVDWKQATTFCKWAGGRLPTDDEWFTEASNSGSRQYPWVGSEVTCDYAVWSQDYRGCDRNSTWPVCSKTAGNSVSGLCDMSGNVYEWTSSSEGACCVVRGGSWDSTAKDELRVSYRDDVGPTLRDEHFGFRCGSSAQ